jgi:pimeloyl-ACP methyl ester carboxylesterase
VRYCCRVTAHARPEFAPIVFLSGAFQTMDSWARFAKAFTPLTTVVLVDLPGTGRSDVLPPEYGVDFLVESARHLIDAHEFDRVSIVAASYGTPVAYRFAQLHPDRVERIVLAGTMREIPEHIRDAVRESVETAMSGNRELLVRQVVDGLLCRDLRLEVDRRSLAERVLRSGIMRMSGTELRQYAFNTARLLQHAPLDLTNPVGGAEALVFTGEHDCFTRPEHCREVAEAFESASFTTVLRADHLFHVEQFNVVSGLLLRFMRGTLQALAPGCSPIARTGYRETSSQVFVSG